MENKRNFYKLCLMMFMQYFIFAVWWVPFAAYLANLKIGMSEVALILSSMAIGSMASPIIGVIADKYMPANRLLLILNILASIFLFAATQQTETIGLMITVTLFMLCYMPSWSLTSAIAMTHAPAELFPRVRLMGSIGWVASGIFSIVAMHVLDYNVFDGTVSPLYCGAIAGLVGAALNLTIPHTPPTGDKSSRISVKEIFGLNTISVLKNRNFNIFILISFLAIIPFNLYHLYGSMFFNDVEVKNITVTMNWGQVAEMVFLFVTTTILIKYGIKKTLIFGMIAMLVRYVSFYIGVEMDQEVFNYVGIIVHGLIFGLFFVGGQVYTDQAVPASLRAQAQGFLSFIIWGVGYLIGTQLNGYLIGEFRAGEICDWGTVFAITSVFTAILLVLLIVLFKDQKKTENSGI